MRSLIVGALLIAVAGCGSWVPLRAPVHVGLQAGAGQTATFYDWYCREGSCSVARTVKLVRGDVRGVMLQDGESQAVVTLQLTRSGVDKIGLLLRGRSPDRELVVMHSGRALLVRSLRSLQKSGSVVLRGPQSPMQTLYGELTRPPGGKK